jgi:hypothetical protein
VNILYYFFSFLLYVISQCVCMCLQLPTPSTLSLPTSSLPHVSTSTPPVFFFFFFCMGVFYAKDVVLYVHLHMVYPLFLSLSSFFSLYIYVSTNTYLHTGIDTCQSEASRCRLDRALSSGNTTSCVVHLSPHIFIPNVPLLAAGRL